MRRKMAIWGLPLLMTVLSGCAVGEKNTSLIYIYGLLSVLALLLLIGYAAAVKKKNPWLMMLFVAVTVVNAGYFLLSASNTLTQALFANRLSYLGSVFLPLAMLMVVLNVTKQRYPKWLPQALIGLCLCVFIIAATPGYSGIYYKEVTLEFVEGVAVLNKVYGPLHSIYLYFLIFFFVTMIVALVRGIAKKRTFSVGHAVILIFAVFANIAVWLMEQLVETQFEFLAVSYIISELFLLGLDLLLQENERIIKKMQTAQAEPPMPAKSSVALPGVVLLTPTERQIFDCYAAGMTGKDVQAAMHITENTLKYHNRNIYSKLGVSSRKELLQLVAQFQEQAQNEE